MIKKLFDAHPNQFTFSVSHTTRNPRAGETPDVDYHFVSRQEFLDLKARDGFIESAQFGDNFYGTSKATIEEQAAKGRRVVLDIEMEGVKQVKASSFGTQAQFVFVAPPSEEELERRLRGRGTEKEENIQKRLAKAKIEIEFARTPGAFDLVVVNDDLHAAYKELEDFVFSAAKPARG